MLDDLTISQILMRLAAISIIAGIHGFAVAGMAVLLGDAGPRHDGRLTVLLSRHLDIFGTIAAVVAGFGWTKQVAIDAGEFRTGRVGLLLVVLAGTIALLLTALGLLALVRPALEGLAYTTGLTTAAFLRIAARMCLWIAIFNLLPVPPLTGAHLLAAVGVKISPRLTWITTAVLLVLLATGVIRAILTPVYDLSAPLVLGAALAGG